MNRYEQHREARRNLDTSRVQLAIECEERLQRCMSPEQREARRLGICVDEVLALRRQGGDHYKALWQK